LTRNRFQGKGSLLEKIYKDNEIVTRNTLERNMSGDIVGLWENENKGGS
jgi:hypothetical protein